MIKSLRPSLFIALVVALLVVAPFPHPASAANVLPNNVITLTPSDLVAKIETADKPFALLVFASWCPYCKQQMDKLNALSPEQRATLPEIYAISIDADPEAYSRFLTTHSGLFFATRLYSGSTSLEVLLQNYASVFNGGIPYTAVFNNKKIIKEFNGLVDPALIAVGN
jgi:thiol-disulfide isomerase/thioredoxin